MPWGDDDDDEFLDGVEADDIDAEDEADFEEFIEEIYEVADLGDDYDGPTVTLHLDTEVGEFDFRIPTEYVQDIIRLAEYFDIEFDVES